MPCLNPQADYDRAVGFLLERINYERALTVPYSQRTFKLQRMRELLAAIGNPHERVPGVHVAGTKGKGSTAAMTAAVLSAAGYRVGLYSSPHLEHIEERLVIDSSQCTTRQLVELVEQVRPAVERLDQTAAREGGESGPTYFDILTAMAFLHFAEQQVDIGVLEVGLGGRLDSTNVCRPLVTVITSISFDHTQQLGDTLTAIATEKAGIIKPGVPVVSGVDQPEPRAVIRAAAEAAGSSLVELGREFSFCYEPPEHLEQAAGRGRMKFEYHAAGARRSLDDVELGLLGQHQAANAAVALATCEELSKRDWNIPESAKRLGLADVRWPARIEVLSRAPTIVLDAAHNVASIEAFLRVLDESFAATKRLLIFATTVEKDVQGMLALIAGRFEHVIFTRYLNNPRSASPQELAEFAQAVGINCTVAETPRDAWQMARKLMTDEHLLAITGSFFIAAEMRAVIEANVCDDNND